MEKETVKYVAMENSSMVYWNGKNAVYTNYLMPPMGWECVGYLATDDIYTAEKELIKRLESRETNER